MTQHKPFTIEEIDQMLEAVNFTQGRMSLPFERSLALLTLARASLAQAPSDEEIDGAAKSYAQGAGEKYAEQTYRCGAHFARKPRLSDEELDRAARQKYGQGYGLDAMDAFKAGYALAWEGEK